MTVSKVMVVVLYPAVLPTVKWGLPVSPLACRCSMVATEAKAQVEVLLGRPMTAPSSRATNAPQSRLRARA
jgi:hypothetical protein